MRFRILICLGIGIILLLSTSVFTAQPVNRITILYDAFGKPSSLKRDWGFSALVEYDGKRILFDTGNDAVTFGQNVKASGIDLRKLDFALISHRHGDHTSGLNYLMTVNPGVKIYAPKEGFVMQSLNGKVALVTGASRGVGKGIALELVDAGAKVYITSRSVKDM